MKLVSSMPTKVFVICLSICIFFVTHHICT